MPENSAIPLLLAVVAADTEGRLRFRSPLVTYTNEHAATARTVWISAQVEAVTGYPADDWIGRRGFFEQILHPDDRDGVVEEMRLSRELLQPFSRDYRLRAKDGRDIWIHDESVPVLDANGNPEFIQGYFIDITERKTLEEALRHAQKTEAVGRLAAGIAHDFNNSLTAIAGYAEFATNAVDPESPARRHLHEISNAVQSAARLTRQLLAVSRRVELRPQMVQLGEVVRAMESMLIHVAGLEVRLEFRLFPTASVNADIGQLEHVLMNLVANARDALDGHGRVVIRTDVTTIPRGAASHRLQIPPGDYAVLAVSDAGKGMAAETVARVFDPFFTTKERGAGTGLGLSTVQGIVRQSGGAVDVWSRPGHGTTFRVLLPVATAR